MAIVVKSAWHNIPFGNSILDSLIFLVGDYEKRKIKKNCFSPIKMTCLYSLGASEPAKVDLTNLQMLSISSAKARESLVTHNTASCSRVSR